MNYISLFIMFVAFINAFAAIASANDIFAHVPRGTFGIVSIDDNRQTIEIIGPDAGELMNWDAVDRDKRTLLSMRVVPESTHLLLKASTSAHITGALLSAVALSDDDLQEFVSNCPKLRSREVEAPIALIPRELGDLSIQERRILELSENTNAAFKCLGQLEDLTYLNLNGLSFGNYDLEFLAQLTQLRFLQLRNMPITDETLVHLKGMTKLEKLDLKGTKITGSGIHFLANCRKLRTLNLDSTLSDDALATYFEQNRTQILSLRVANCPISKEELRRLKESLPFTDVSDEKGLDTPIWTATTNSNPTDVSPHDARLQLRADLFLLTSRQEVPLLRKYNISLFRNGGKANVDESISVLVLTNSNPVTDATLSYVGLMRHLKGLEISKNKSFSSDGIRMLKSMPQLKVLLLPPTHLTAREVQQICQISQLRHLSLHGTSIGDKDVEELTKLRELEVLDLGETDVTDGVILVTKQFQKLSVLGLEGCKITDSGAKGLLDLKKLKRVFLSGTKISREMKAFLQENNHDLIIECDDLHR